MKAFLVIVLTLILLAVALVALSAVAATQGQPCVKGSSSFCK